MTIMIHCDHCGKEIKAADSAGGKWGKCPFCQNRLYVPSLDSGEELKLAPVDTTAEEREKQLIAETHKLTQDILQERDIPNELAETAEPPISKLKEEELTKNIIMYLRKMADGELYEAQRIANHISPYGSQAVEIIDRIALSEIPEPELADIPQQVLAGLVRTLRTKVS